MIVLDTSFLIGYHNASDVNHAAANDLMERVVGGEWGDALLPEYVLLETMTVLAVRRDVATARRVGEHLLASRDVRFVSGSDHFASAWDVFRAQEGPALSFADAAIVATARAMGTPWIATFDRGFEGLEGIRVVRG